MIGQMPPMVFEGVLQQLQQHVSPAVTIKGFSFASGGCINHGGKLTTSEGNFFVKWNSAAKFPDMFQAESKGLTLLGAPSAIRLPHVISVGESGSFQFLVLEFIEERPRIKNYGELLGRQLALLHQVRANSFGLGHNNYIGSLKQLNESRPTWVDFFIHQRLAVQLQLASGNGLADTALLKKFDDLYKKLPSLLPEEAPSLLHGDLWGGNLMTDEKGSPCLIDPAVYYGNREADLAMTRLFGGFSEEFYKSYQEAFPLSAGWKNRVGLYNLYPLLVHVNLFGGGYVAQVSSVLRQYVD